MKKKTILSCILMLIIVVSLKINLVYAFDVPIYEEGFEGSSGWSAENGVWEVGVPSSGPEESHDGLQCAGTVLGGNYYNHTDSRLIVPYQFPWEQGIELPNVAGNEEIHLRFWQWFNYYPYNWSSSQDWGQVEISTYDETSGWSDWQSLGTHIQDYGGYWSQKSVELTAYAGQKVRIAFNHISDEQDVYSGWYIDDIQVVKKVPELGGTFEDGWGDWYADNGIWQIDEKEDHNGVMTQCAGTAFQGNYQNFTDSRLISPTFTVPSDLVGNEEIHLRFWQWFNYYPYNWSSSQDWGQVEISTYDETSGWSDWQSLGTHIQDYGGYWSQKSVELTAYAGQKVRIAFNHISDEQDVYSGWYIDDIQVVKKAPELGGTFEDGWGDWYADNGIWQIDEKEDHNGGMTQCAGTAFQGNYQNFTDSRLISPTFMVPFDLVGNEEIHLRFWQWFNYYPYNWSSSQDWGQVEISTYDEASGWSDWESLGIHTQDYGGYWSQKSVELTAYAGQKVRIAFNHISDEQDISSGWYIDDIQINKRMPVFTGDFEMGWMDWSADNGIWQIGTPTNGPDGCYDGDQCPGTVMSGNYPEFTDSRLISAPVDLTSGSLSMVYLKFWEWFSYSDDYGEVQVSAWDPVEELWSEWIPLIRSTATSHVWTLKYVDLFAYSGKIFRIGFLHTSGSSKVSHGWFIDNLELVGPDEIMPTIDRISFTPYIPEPCTSLIDVLASDPVGGELTYSWQLPDGGTLEGVGANMEFIAPEIRVEPYRVLVAASSNITQISSFTRTLKIYTQVLYDLNDDGDIDGQDLSQFIAREEAAGDTLTRLAEEFGMIACRR